MKHVMISLYRSAKSGFNRFAFALLALFALAAGAHADDVSPLETAATTAITGAKTSATNILIAAFGIVVVFVLYKLIRRATNKV